MLDRLPIRVTAPIAIAAPALVLGLVLTALWYVHSRRAVMDLADRSIEQIHRQVAGHVESLLSIPLRVCALNAHLVETGALPTGDLASWRDTLIEQAAAFDELSVIGWGDAEGRTVWLGRYADGHRYFALKDDPAQPNLREWRLNPDGALPPEPTSEFAFDTLSRPWFTAPRDAGEATWSEPYVWQGGSEGERYTLGLSYGVPLFGDDGAFRGVIETDLSLTDISAYLRTIEVGETGEAFIVSPDGRLIAASGDTPVVTDDGERVDALESPDPLVSGVARLVREESDLGRHAEVTVRGEPKLLRASPIGEAVGLDWTLATVVPLSDFTAGIDAGVRRSLGASALAILAAALLGVGATMLLVRPILSAVTYARRIGQGDLDTRVSLSGSTELVHLGDELDTMVAGLRDRLRMREALSLAMEVQQNLLPASAPTIRGLDIAGHSTYCDETGGDYYDFLDIGGLDESTAAIALGDVAGHGVAAAMLMATARGILRSRAAAPGSLGDLLTHLNRLLVKDADGHRFMTMLLVTISATRSEFRWASAGHGPPIVYDPARLGFLQMGGGDLPLGLIDDERFEEHEETPLERGQIVLAATDGLWETMGEQEGMFGMDRVRQVIARNAHRSAAEISEAIRDAVARFRGAAPPLDDLTFVVVKVL